MRPKCSAELLSDRRRRALKLLDEEFSFLEQSCAALQKLLHQYPRLLIEHFPSYARNSTPMKESGSDNSQTVGPMTSTNS